MNLELPEAINKDQWIEALGVKGKPDNQLLTQLGQGEKEILGVAKPQGIYRILKREEMELPGKNIKRHLVHCEKMIIMAITLGIGVDNLLRKTQVNDMGKTIILDWGASILIEEIADEFQKKIKEDVGQFMTGRYSPGYGDLPIEIQNKFIQAIDGPRKIGLNVTSSHIMIPRKSVTAILGISDRPVTGYLATCEECQLRGKCLLRKEGYYCGKK
ncbi:MAG: methionine synthase [Anaerovoracaceae bacterium]